jgi:O-antigen/teichoic acid export membrane protein
LGAILESLMSHIFIKPKPKITYDTQQVKEMLKKGKWVTGSIIFSYLFEQGDDMFVGKLLNTTALGVYQAAYKLSTLPITEIAQVFNQVTFPIYSNFADDTKRLKRAFLRITLTIFLLILPVGFVLYFYATEVVVLVLGPKWLEVIPILKVLSVYGIVRALIVSMNPLFNSAKKQKYLATITLVNLIVMIFTIAPMILHFGVNGAGYSIILASFVSLPVIYRYLLKVFRQTI